MFIGQNQRFYAFGPKLLDLSGDFRSLFIRTGQFVQDTPAPIRVYSICRRCDAVRTQCFCGNSHELLDRRTACFPSAYVKNNPHESTEAVFTASPLLPGIGAVDGARTRDLRRDRPAL